jgi:ligand-binding SRPBCC domain-containing protein
MPFLHLTLFIAAPQQRVFDLSRSIELHARSMERYGEKAVAGKMSGLMELNDTVTWTARHLFKTRKLTSRITAIRPYEYFVDEQTDGDFAFIKHEHYFKPIQNGTLLIDQFRFETPYGAFGRLVNNLFLEKYMTRLLNGRNAVIKEIAEGTGWQQYLPQ